MSSHISHMSPAGGTNLSHIYANKCKLTLGWWLCHLSVDVKAAAASQIRCIRCATFRSLVYVWSVIEFLSWVSWWRKFIRVVIWGAEGVTRLVSGQWLVYRGQRYQTYFFLPLQLMWLVLWNADPNFLTPNKTVLLCVTRDLLSFNNDRVNHFPCSHSQNIVRCISSCPLNGAAHIKIGFPWIVALATVAAWHMSVSVDKMSRIEIF